MHFNKEDNNVCFYDLFILSLYTVGLLVNNTDKVVAGQHRQSRKDNLLKRRIAGQHRQSRKDNLLKKRIAEQHRQSRNDNLIKRTLPDNTDKV